MLLSFLITSVFLIKNYVIIDRPNIFSLLQISSKLNVFFLIQIKFDELIILAK